MKRIFSIISLSLLIMLFTGCSNHSSEENSQADKAPSEAESKSSLTNQAEVEQDANMKSETEVNMDQKDNETAEIKEMNQQARKVIYTANLSIKVESYEQTLKLIQQKLSEANGYIVNSNSNSIGEDEGLEGTITVRIPQNKFESFIQAVEAGSTKVIERNITGQDVTEEFVDLESRLKSKQVVEARLLDFMKNAEKTEDLLKISTDLATVQEEIEQIKGRMNYLSNQVELSTVTIYMTQDSVKVPSLDNENLNTWEKTKEQFMKSLNFLLQAGSSLFVLFVGSLPILILIGGLLFLFWLLVIKRRKQNGKPPKIDQTND